MKSGLKLALGLIAVAATASPAMASHANPWATDDDTVLAKNHDENQAKSIDTPGEDEMRGKLVRNAYGKLGGNDRGKSTLGGGAKSGRMVGGGVAHD